VTRAVDNAYDATKAGKNDLYRCYADEDGDRYLLRV
jgi:hypothetical protein